MSTLAKPKYAPRTTPARSVRARAGSFAPLLTSASATFVLGSATALLFAAFLFVSVETQLTDVRLTDLRMAIMHQADAIALAQAERLSLGSDLVSKEKAQGLGLAFPKRSTVIRVTRDELSAGSSPLENFVYGSPVDSRLSVGKVRFVSR